MLIDLVLGILPPLQDFLAHPEVYNYKINWQMFYHPAFSSFLSGASIGHMPQILYIWMLPIILLLLYAGFPVLEKKCGISNIYISKIGKKQYIRKKLICSFVFSFGIVFITLLLNFILASLILHKATDMTGMDQYTREELGNFIYWQVQHPYFAYMIYLLSFSCSAGMCGLICQSSAFIFRNNITIYLVSFIAWILQFTTKISISTLGQPFTEYGLSDFCYSWIQLIIITFIFIIVAILKRSKQDEV